jgi:hypothetical protein
MMYDPLGSGNGSKGDAAAGFLFGPLGWLGSLFGGLFGGEESGSGGGSSGGGYAPPPAQSGGGSQASSLLNQILPILILVAVVFLALKYGKKLLK